MASIEEFMKSTYMILGSLSLDENSYRICDRLRCYLSLNMFVCLLNIVRIAEMKLVMLIFIGF